MGRGRLEGRKALITGGDSGIGSAVAVAYAREGADVAISYLPEEQADADRVIAAIEEAGRKALALPGDLCDLEQCQHIVAKTVEEFGGLDILVNNASRQLWHDGLENIPEDDFDRVMKSNIYSSFRGDEGSTGTPGARLLHHFHLIDPGIRSVGYIAGLRDDEGSHEQSGEGPRPAASHLRGSE